MPLMQDIHQTGQELVFVLLFYAPMCTSALASQSSVGRSYEFTCLQIRMILRKQECSSKVCNKLLKSCMYEFICIIYLSAKHWKGKLKSSEIHVCSIGNNTYLHSDSANPQIRISAISANPHIHHIHKSANPHICHIRIQIPQIRISAYLRKQVCDCKIIYIYIM